MRILVIEDEPKLNRGIVRGLQERGFIVDSAQDGEEGEGLARMNEYDILLLDVLMPARDGLTVCKSLRTAGIHTPIIFLTAKDSLQDRIIGLEGGGDDYIVKPFSFEELVARIRTVLRRPRSLVPDMIQAGGLKLSQPTHQVTADGVPIILTLREFTLLEYLLRNRGLVLSREDLLEHVWDRNFASLSNVVDVHLKNLRKKLPEPYGSKIETVWGKGYRFAA